MGDVVIEIFSQSRFGFPACVAWHRVLLLGVSSPWSHPLNLSHHYLFQALDVDPYVECEAMLEDE